MFLKRLYRTVTHIIEVNRNGYKGNWKPLVRSVWAISNCYCWEDPNGCQCGG